MRFIRALGVAGATTLLWAAGMGPGLAGCGGPAEVAKAPNPAKVMWGSSDVAAEPDAPSASEVPTPESPEKETEKRGGSPVEVDLDAPAPEEKKAEASKVEAAPEEEEAEEEEPAAETPALEEPRAPRPLEKEMRAAVKSKEKKEKSSKPKKAVAKKSEPAEPAARAFSGPNPCKASSFTVTRVGNACATAGRSGAKGVMKDAISKALAAGTTLKCSDCHAEQRDYTLKAEAVEQLQKWLGGGS